jgi:hypothetical protein
MADGDNIMTNPIPGRAHTPEQKRANIERLYSLWLAQPDLRLAQLIFAGTGGRDIFSIEDDAFIAELEERLVLLKAPRCIATHGISSEDLASLSEAILGMADEEHSIAIEGIWLMREGGESDPLAKAVVYVQMQGRWYEAIRESIDSNFSHCVSSYGLASDQLKLADWNEAPQESEQES